MYALCPRAVRHTYQAKPSCPCYNCYILHTCFCYVYAMYTYLLCYIYVYSPNMYIPPTCILLTCWCYVHACILLIYVTIYSLLACYILSGYIMYIMLIITIITLLTCCCHLYVHSIYLLLLHHLCVYC